MTQELVGYFGFGSLVNPDTLRTNYLKSVPASLKGWRRHWQSRSIPLDADVALLSVHQHENCTIKGRMVVDYLANLPQVDKREAGYTRHKLDLGDLSFPEAVELPENLYVYVANEPSESTDDGALLQSYLDAVMQGFYREYGEKGVRHFMETTTNFGRNLIRDRNTPLYPRSVSLTQAETHLFDELVEAVVLG